MFDINTTFDNEKSFDYKKAFSRNIGWVTEAEQEALRSKRIAIPGLGGVGGYHFYMFLRLGVSKFHIADFDDFSIENFNRQVGATISSIGRKKTNHMSCIARDINPDVEIKAFNSGVNERNIDEFLDGVDLVVDGLDLYEMDLRIQLFGRAHQLGIPVITAGPFGMGTSFMSFSPKSMSFNEYFDLDRPYLTNQAKVVRFLVGVAPKLLHRSYVADPKNVKLFESRLPSLHVGVLSATAALGSTALKILLNRGEVIWAPRGYQVDFYRNKFAKFWCPWGNRNPLQRFRIKTAFRMFKVQEFQ